MFHVLTPLFTHNTTRTLYVNNYIHMYVYDYVRYIFCLPRAFSLHVHVFVTLQIHAPTTVEVNWLVKHCCQEGPVLGYGVTFYNAEEC